MKKLYFLATFLFLAFINHGFSQYTAINSGNWSSPITWAPGAIPSTVCNNCTITINSGVTIQVDAHTELQGASVLTIKDGAKLIIGNSSQTSISSGFNIVLDTLPGTSTIVFSTANSKIDATSAGTYDGIFVGPFPNFIFQKVIGNAPSLFILNSVVGTAKPNYGNLFSGPNTLFSGGTLPIILSSFNAQFADDVSKLTWTTDLEINSSKFEILRSGDGVSWKSIGTVAAKGNSTNSTDYSFTDPSPLNGVNYYRLKEIDIDQNFKLSDIRFIHGASIKGIRFINPARNTLQITFGSDVSTNLSLRLLSLNGQVLQEKQLNNAAGETIYMPVNSYANGIYMLHVTGNNGAQIIYKVVVNN
ncbi:MAG TPA: T9SS type A sorting domain-containing protein [Puia sp.]|nr:T9SS type A sorting domain-containing protein [Puia sp.]